MTDISLSRRFDRVLYALPDRLAEVLRRLPAFIKSGAFEIRLRCGRPVTLTGVQSFYVTDDAVATTEPFGRLLVPTREELDETVMLITDRSVYNRSGELSRGYLSMKYGCRAGVCGSFYEGKLSEITSINIRIAKEIKGCARPLVEAAREGLLIAGPPGSGKTTLLRDLVRLLSDGGSRVAVVDSRGEICGKSEDGFYLDVGQNTDVITGADKAAGVEMALRTMFPEYIAFDEVGTGKELALIRESFFSGVKIITTAHAGASGDILNREVTRMLTDGCVGNIALLSGTPGGRISVAPLGERAC